VNFGTLTKKITLSFDLREFKFKTARVVVNVHVPAKYHQAKCRGSRVIVYTNVFVKSRNDKESEHPVLQP